MQSLPEGQLTRGSVDLIEEVPLCTHVFSYLMYYITRLKYRIILSITSERNAVVALPCSSATRPCLCIQVASSLQSTVFSTSSG